MTSSRATTTDDGIPGAYGLRLAGMESLRAHLVPAPGSWPLVTVHRTGCVEPVVDTDFAADSTSSSLIDTSGSVVLHGVRLDREPLRAQLCGPGPRDDHSMIHPGLATIGAVVNRWLGREAFHAGAFHHDGGAWAVLGAKEAGKSSLLGLLAAAGVGVLADDVLVLDEDGEALAGPRCIDLREGAATFLGQGEDIGLIGQRRRWRMTVAAGPVAVPLRGWIMPTWGPEIDVRPVSPRERLPLLYANLAILRAPTQPSRFLRLGAMPFLEFRRPRDWAVAEKATAALLADLPG